MLQHSVPILSLSLLFAAQASAMDDGFSVETVLEADVPVFFTFAPDGRLFYNECETGRVRVTDAQFNVLPDPVATFDDVEVFFERGFLGLELDPDFDENHYLYVYYSSIDGSHKLVRIQEEDNQAVEIVYLRDDLPLMGQGNHNGGPIVFGPDKSMYLSIGELSFQDNAQDLEIEAGKILRMNRDGTIPADNPFGPDSTVYAYGIRNTFGLTFNALTGQFYGSENGPTIGDEINLLEPGLNYGWPLWTGAPHQNGFADAIFAWTEEGICPTGIAIYCGSNYPSSYLNDIFVGTCDTGRIRHFKLSEDGTSAYDQDPVWYEQPQEGLDYEESYYGVLDVQNGPDGNIWFSTALGIYRVVYDGAPAGPADIDCDLFDGEFPGVGWWDDDDDATPVDDDTGDDDDSADVVYKKCVCDGSGGGVGASLAVLLALFGAIWLRKSFYI